MARRSDHSREQIRQMALNAAETIIAKEGYKGLTTRNVALSIGYTVGTLYLVFENLDDLVLQVNSRTLDALYEWLRARRGNSNAIREDLLALADAYIDYAQTETARWNLLFEYVAEQGNDLPDWYLTKLNTIFSLVEGTLKPLAEQRTEVEIQQVARVLWASVHGICTLKIRNRMDLAGGQTTQEMVRSLIDTFLRGFQK